jgi:hypothetical protein
MRAIARLKTLRDSTPARRAAGVCGLLGMAAGLAGTVGNLEKIPSQVCRAPGVYLACQWAEIGGVASEREEAHWQNASATLDGGALRAYLRAYPDGAYAAQATARLAACRSEQVESWVPVTRPLPLFVAPSHSQLRSLAEAETAARQRIQDEARRSCNAFTGEFRVVSGHVDEPSVLCTTSANRITCGFDGTATCELEARQLHAIERCQ